MLGKLIRELRTNKYSQRELAQKLKVSHSYISKIENSEAIFISDELLTSLSNVLECDETLMYFAAQRIPPSLIDLEFNPEYSTYKNLKLQWLKLFNSEIISDRLSLLYHAFEQSEMGYAILRRSDLETVFVSDQMAKAFSDLNITIGTIDIASLIPNLYTILKQYTIGSQNRRGILPLVYGGQIGYIEFIAHRFTMNEDHYVLIETIHIYDNLEGTNHLLGIDFCLQPFFEQMPLGLLLVKYDDGKTDPTIINCNTLFSSMLGYERTALLNGDIPYSEIELTMGSQRVRDEVLLSNKTLNYPGIYIHKNGHYIATEVHAHLFDFGPEKGFVYIVKPLENQSNST